MPLQKGGSPEPPKKWPRRGGTRSPLQNASQGGGGREATLKRPQGGWGSTEPPAAPQGLRSEPPPPPPPRFVHAASERGAVRQKSFYSILCIQTSLFLGGGGIEIEPPFPFTKRGEAAPGAGGGAPYKTRIEKRTKKGVFGSRFFGTK